MSNLFQTNNIKGGVKTDTFAQITNQKSYLEIRGISEELFDRLCEDLVLDCDLLATDSQE